MSVYSRPPITEAVIELRPKRPFTVADLDRIEQKLLQRYPNKALMYAAKIEIKANQRVESSTVEDGRRLSSLDGADIVILKQSSFCVSRQAPYCGWQRFFEQFLTEFSIVQKITKVSSFDRMGLRFINRIDVPNDGTQIRIEDYLRLSINTPEDTDLIARYTLQAVFPAPDYKCDVIVNSALIPPPLIDKTSFLLDVDVVSDADDLSFNEVVERFGQMRELKNISFESYITDKTRILFE